MTNREHIIQELNKSIYFTKEIEEIFDLICDRDWTYFISQMGDYDHPSERTSADRHFDEEMKNHSATLFEKIVERLNGEIGKEYSIHTLKDEHK